MPENMTDKPEGEPEEQTAAASEEEDRKECPELRFAAEAVAKAKVELEAAERLYEEVRRKAVKKIEALKQCNLGEALEGTRCFVKKHPGLSLFLGAAAGFWIGRWFQRLFRR